MIEVSIPRRLQCSVFFFVCFFSHKTLQRSAQENKSADTRGGERTRALHSSISRSLQRKTLEDRAFPRPNAKKIRVLQSNFLETPHSGPPFNVGRILTLMF